jgi:hypothetical protein
MFATPWRGRRSARRGTRIIAVDSLIRTFTRRLRSLGTVMLAVIGLAATGGGDFPRF